MDLNGYTNRLIRNENELNWLWIWCRNDDSIYDFANLLANMRLNAASIRSCAQLCRFRYVRIFGYWKIATFIDWCNSKLNRCQIKVVTLCWLDFEYKCIYFCIECLSCIEISANACHYHKQIFVSYEKCTRFSFSFEWIFIAKWWLATVCIDSMGYAIKKCTREVCCTKGRAVTDNS